jgi:hypothetical protein
MVLFLAKVKATIRMNVETLPALFFQIVQRLPGIVDGFLLLGDLLFVLGVFFVP